MSGSKCVVNLSSFVMLGLPLKKDGGKQSKHVYLQVYSTFPSQEETFPFLGFQIS